MATTTKKKPTAKEVDMSDVMAVADEPATIDLKKTSAGVVRIEDTALINVKSNVFGELIFVDPVTKAKVKWSQCGEPLQLPLAMLRNMKNGAVKFFTNQLVIITGFADENAEKYEVADIYKALYITQYYKDILDPTNYDEICSWTPAEIKQNQFITLGQSAWPVGSALSFILLVLVLISMAIMRRAEHDAGEEGGMLW